MRIENVQASVDKLTDVTTYKFLAFPTVITERNRAKKQKAEAGIKSQTRLLTVAMFYETRHFAFFNLFRVPPTVNLVTPLNAWSRNKTAESIALYDCRFRFLIDYATFKRPVRLSRHKNVSQIPRITASDPFKLPD